MATPLSQLPPPPQGQTGLSFNDLKNLPPPPSGQQGLTLEQIQTPPAAAPTTDNPQYTNKGGAGNAVLGAANATSQFLGIQKLGAGLATAGRVVTGGINQTGDANGQALRDQQAVINQIHTLRAQGVQPNDLRMMQLTNFLKQAQSGNADPAYHAPGTTTPSAPTQAEIDPGTQLSNKEVLGSAANTALLASTPGAPTGSSLAGKVAAGAALGYASDVAQSANNNQQSIFKPGLGTAVGAGLPVVSAVGGAILKRVAGLTTGAGTDVIQRAINNPTEVNAAINQFAKTPEAKQQLVDTAKTSINNYLQARSKQFGTTLASLTTNEPIPKQAVVDSFASAIGKFGGQVKDGSLVFEDTALNSAEQKGVQDVFNVVKDWKNTSVQGMETLRQRIGNEMDNFKFANNGRDSAILGAVKQDLTKTIGDKVPGYADMLKTYGTQTQTAKNLADELSLKSGNAKASTQLNQIMKLFKKDPVVMENLTKTMGPTEANKFLNDVSGAILSSWMPQTGLAAKIVGGAAETGAIGAGALMHIPGALPSAAAGAAISSPKLVGKTAIAAGKIAQSGAGTAARKAATIAASKANQP